MTLVSAGPDVEFTVTPVNSGTVLLAVPPSFDILDGTSGLSDGEQVLVALGSDGGPLPFTLAGAGFVELDPSTLGEAASEFPSDATLAAFDFVGAPSCCRRAAVPHAHVSSGRFR